MVRQELSGLKRFIWPPASVRPTNLYAVLDSARDPAIYDFIHRSYREHTCLFAGNLDLELERAAPFLLQLEQRDSLTDELLSRGWSNAWMVLIRSEKSFRSIRRHLRTLLRVRTEDGRFLLFRFYDPRVLSLYLPTCNAEELSTVFGEYVERWFCVDQNKGETTGYALINGALEQYTSSELAKQDQAREAS